MKRSKLKFDIMWLTPLIATLAICGCFAYLYSYFTATASKDGDIHFHTLELAVTSTNTDSALFETEINDLVPGGTVTFNNVSIANTGSADAYTLVNVNVTIKRNGYTDYVIDNWYNLSGVEVNVANMSSNTTQASEIKAGNSTLTNFSVSFPGAQFDNSFKKATATATIRAVGIQTRNLPQINSITQAPLIASYMLIDMFYEPQLQNTIDMSQSTETKSLMVTTPDETATVSGTQQDLYNVNLLNASAGDTVYVQAKNANTIKIAVGEHSMETMKNNPPAGTITASGQTVTSFTIEGEEIALSTSSNTRLSRVGTAFDGKVTVYATYTTAKPEITIYTVPKSATKVNADTFKGSLITEVEIPGSATTIDKNAFQNSSLTDVTLNATNGYVWKVYNSNDEIVCEDASKISTTQLITYLKGDYYLEQISTNLDYQLSKDGSYYTVYATPDTEGEVYYVAYYKGKPVKEVGAIQSPYLPVTKVVFPENSQITKIHYNAFFGWEITEINLEANKHLVEIDGYAFEDCFDLTNIKFPESLTTIGQNAFAWSALTEVEIPASVTSIGVAVFGETPLTRVKLNTKDGYMWKIYDVYTEEYVGVNVSLLTEEEVCAYFAPDSPYAFEQVEIPICYTLSDDGSYYIVCGLEDETITQLVIPAYYKGKPVKEVGPCVYPYMPVTEVRFAKNNHITKIDSSAFFGWDISSINLEDLDQLTEIGESAFEACGNLTEITIPDTVTTIAYAAFLGCGFNYVEIPKNCTSIGADAFAECPLTSVKLNAKDGYVWQVYDTYETGELLCSDISCLTEEELIEYLTFGYGYGFKQVESPLEFTLSDSGTYYIVSGLKNDDILCVNIPAMYKGKPVKEIGERAFTGSGPSVVTFAEDSQITIIRKYAFSASDIASIKIPASVITIEEWAFATISLNSISFEENSKLQTIGNNAFKSTGISSIAIPASVTSIGNNAFFDCSLTSATLNAKSGYVWKVYNSSNQVVCADTSKIEPTQLITYLTGEYHFEQVAK